MKIIKEKTPLLSKLESAEIKVKHILFKKIKAGKYDKLGQINKEKNKYMDRHDWIT